MDAEPKPTPDETPRSYAARIFVWGLYTVAALGACALHALALKYLGVIP